MKRITVVIPSRLDANLAACLEALREREGRDVRVVVVDDGLQEPDRSAAWADVVLPGVQPFVYARNCNRGIEFAAGDDIVLLNDDAQLRTAGGLQMLQRAAAEEPAYGLIAATCNNVGNRNQWPQGVGLREDPRIVCFVAVLIPRRTIDLVGLLDERFTGYGFEDDDYCYRIRRAGLKIGIHDGCFVDHGSLRSTFRGAPGMGGDLTVGRQIFIEKWGSYPL